MPSNPTAPLLTESDDDLGRFVLRLIRGCATDDQYIETLERVKTAFTTIRQEERTAERKRVLGVIKRVPATAAGADAFRKRLIEELYVEAAANETREDGDDG